MDKESIIALLEKSKAAKLAAAAPKAEPSVPPQKEEARDPVLNESIVRQTSAKCACEFYAHKDATAEQVILFATLLENWISRKVKR